MKKAPSFGTRTSLVFCSEDVDPDVVTHALDLQPTFSQKVGETAAHWNDAEYVSRLGTWKLTLPVDFEDVPVEHQIEKWLEMLHPKYSQLHTLIASGYTPYLDCPGQRDDLSLYIEPSILQQLGELKIGLSLWLYKPVHN